MKYWESAEFQLSVSLSFSSGQWGLYCLLPGQWRQAQALFQTTTGRLPSVETPYLYTSPLSFFFFFFSPPSLTVCKEQNDLNTPFWFWGSSINRALHQEKMVTGVNSPQVCLVPGFSVGISTRMVLMMWTHPQTDNWIYFYISGDFFSRLPTSLHSSVLHKYWQNNYIILLPWKGEDRESRVYPSQIWVESWFLFLFGAHFLWNPWSACVRSSNKVCLMATAGLCVSETSQ